MKKTTLLRKAIMDRRAVVVPGAHDALSAKVIEQLRLRGDSDLGLRTGRQHPRQAGRRPGANERRPGHDLEHRPGGGHSGDGRRRHRRRQRRQRRLDHRAADPDGHGGHEHRGPGVPQALRPHGRQGSDLGRGDGGQGPRLLRRAEPAGQGLHHQRPHRRLRRPAAWRKPSAAATCTWPPGPTWRSSTASAPARTSRRRSPASRARSRST